MKYYKFYFAALAAMSIVSCTNEQDIRGIDAPGLKPGEALVTFDVRGKVASRASDAQEKAIKSLVYKLYDGNGDSVQINRQVTTSKSMIRFSIDSDKVASLNGNTMNLLVAVNSLNQLDYGTFTEAQDATEDKDLRNEFDEALTGLPASAKATFTMSSGSHTIAANNKAKRIVSRIYVTKDATSTGNITGMQVIVNDVATSANLFKDEVIATPVGSSKSYTINKEEPQPIAYVYPTESGASVAITLNGTSKTFPLPSLKKNNNYAVNIITSTSDGGASGSWDVSIEDWGGDTSIDADMNGGAPTTAVVPALKTTFPNTGNLKVENGKLVANVISSREVTATELFVDPITITDVIGVETVNGTRASALDGEVSTDGVVRVKKTDTGLTITVENTTVGQADKEYKIKFTGLKDGVTSNYELPIVAKGYPENFSITFNGIEMMTVGIQNETASINPSSIIDVVEAVNAMTGGTFAEKAKAYVAQNQDVYEQKYIGKAVIKALPAHCPAGFEIPTYAQVRQAFGGIDLAIATSGNNLVLTPDAAATSSHFEAGNSIQLLTSPHRHFVFTPKAGPKVYIPAGDKNGLLNIPANNFVFTSTRTYKQSRLVFWANELQMRDIPNPEGDLITNFLRCVRKVSAAN